jgi:hypothetical protein
MEHLRSPGSLDGLDQRGDRQGAAWVRYVTSYFPRGRNDESSARLLWEDWRTCIVKIPAPGNRVLVTHGQSHVHWKHDKLGRLILNLEDLWADFAYSVDRFVAELRTNVERRAVALSRLRRLTVETIEVAPTITAAASGCELPTVAPVTTASAIGGGQMLSIPPVKS